MRAQAIYYLAGRVSIALMSDLEFQQVSTKSYTACRLLKDRRLVCAPQQTSQLALVICHLLMHLSCKAACLMVPHSLLTGFELGTVPGVAYSC